ncbi:MAG TPA: hypothetical protein VFE47_30540 [Tepidisphaeraceae bacterium]|jgi:hypothetical protein|nr:hypothetical protein [Tepidisphaeraceae bacterium]
MPLQFKPGFGPRDVMKEDFYLRENPFRISAIDNPDIEPPYDRKMYGEQYEEFCERFFLRPLMQDKNKQVIGAIWSSQSASDWRGFGKSMLMRQESKLICEDLGADLLRTHGVLEDDITQNAILAGYCTFDQAKEVKTFASALLDAVAFILGQKYGGMTVHQELRRRIAANLSAEAGFEGEAVARALRDKLRSYQSLNVQLNHKTLEKFIDLLCRDDTASLISEIRNGIGPRVKSTQGFNFVHVFNAYALLAGVVSITYFVDQIENFAKWARNQDREIRVLRESMCATSPTAEMASFVFQMHISALQEIEGWWATTEHLPSLDFAVPINRSRIIDLKGLRTKEEAESLASRYLREFRLEHVGKTDPLHPFPKEVIAVVRDATKGNPRKFLETLGSILDNAVADTRQTIDLVFVEPLLASDYQDDTDDLGDDDLENVER